MKATGGTVCLAAGVYALAEPVNADGARSLRIHGQGPATILVARGTAFTARAARARSTLESLAILSGAAGAPRRSAFAAAIAHERPRPRRPLVRLGRPAAARRSSSPVSRSLVVAPPQRSRRAAQASTPGGRQADRRLGRGAARSRTTSSSGSTAASTSAAGRRTFTRAASSATSCSPATSAGSSPPAWSRPARPSTSSATRSSHEGRGSSSAPTSTVDSNAVLRLGRGRRDRRHRRSPPAASRRNPATYASPATGCTASRGPPSPFAPPSAASWSRRTSPRCRRGHRDRGPRAAERVAVDNNEIFDVVGTREGAGSAIGILLVRATSVAAVGNTVARVGLALQDGLVRAGIVVVSAEDVRLSGNVVDAVGAPDGFVGLAVGLAVGGPFTAASVVDNSARFSADAPRPRRAAGMRSSSSRRPRVRRASARSRRSRPATTRSSSRTASASWRRAHRARRRDVELARRRRQPRDLPRSRRGRRRRAGEPVPARRGAGAGRNPDPGHVGDRVVEPRARRPLDARPPGRRRTASPPSATSRQAARTSNARRRAARAVEPAEPDRLVTLTLGGKPCP